MSDKPATQGNMPAIDDEFALAEQASDLTVAGTEASSGSSGHSPVDSSRQPSLNGWLARTRSLLTPPDSQSPFTSESRVLSSDNTSTAAQPDLSSTNSWAVAMTTSAISPIQRVYSVGNLPYSSTLPPRLSFGAFATGYASAAYPVGFQGNYSGFVNPSGRRKQLYGLPEARAHVEAERQKIMQSFQEPPSTPSSRNTQQERGSVTTADMSPPPMHRRQNKECCSFPDLSRAQSGGLAYCQTCGGFTKEDPGASGAASSSTSSEALVQCCSDPIPFDICEEHGATHIECLNCGKAHDADQMFEATQEMPPHPTSATDWCGINKVNDGLDPNRIRMVKYPRDESPDMFSSLKRFRYSDSDPIGHSIGPAQFRKLLAPSVYARPKDEDLFRQCYDAEKSLCDGPTFHKFMELPRELRERVYEFVLKSNKSIAPHLCDAGRPAHKGKANCGKAIRFHDDNQANHNAICKMLTITRVSKQVRQESLPIFYGVNTFDTVEDTPTYFTRLEQLDRFHMIRHVNFWVRFWKSEQYPQKRLRMLLQNFEDQKVFEMNHSEATRNEHSKKAKATTAAQNAAAKGELSNMLNDPGDTKFYTDNLDVLKSHPLHAMGGIEANFLVLRMLSAQFQDGEYNRQLVIHVPTTTLFSQYNSLLYFPLMCEGLGIQLKLISGRDVEMGGSSFRLSWHQKYQKKDFTDSTTANNWNEVEALTRRVQALYPNIEEVPRPARWSYYRRLCKQNEIEWFTIHTAGGGIL
ncbi:hypothetical protein P171DRAFT_470957 [Karstenula rhodostoma CBS 690.94]|uniref:2EXR domain-containing protein n=1 Tax=Karstenula rhodostoma CBS 690.94 TaxID=1392251 RepID=A0A9P4UFQ9_9PLEO|nr:hypothetical protein P171DRAFT_470957 [Karstenula rhodostoma CBS 690.94]